MAREGNSIRRKQILREIQKAHVEIIDLTKEETEKLKRETRIFEQIHQDLDARDKKN